MVIRTLLPLLLFSLSFITASHASHGILRDVHGFDAGMSVAQISGLRNESFSLISGELPEGTCNSATPCANGACCGKNNLCGYNPKQECGSGCQFNCTAKAECGPYSLPGHSKCPLNVCCSKFGFCGSTNEFCTWTNAADPDYPTCSTSYGGCGAVKRPSCGSGSSVAKRTIGYYETWSNTRKVSPVAPEDLNLDGFTHINFAFSFFDPSTFEITSMDTNADSLYQRFTKLKEKKSGLQAWISVGGWSFTDPGPTQKAFSNMVSTSENRAKFINNLKIFMNTYGFDGVDLDWEYPGADDRGGSKADSQNYVLFVQELRSSLGAKYGISMTLPTSYWYLQHFDLPGIQQHIDWFNLMAYDLHGVWDKVSKFVGPFVKPHTNLTEIDLGLDLLWRAGVKPGNVILGLGWYGRSFTLLESSCNVPNGACKFSDAAKAGPNSNAAGILTNQEIFEVIKKNRLNPAWDKIAGVKWITWDNDQWVSYDDDDTFKQKREFGNSRCLGGTMVWAMDQVAQSSSNSLSPGGGDITKQAQDTAKQMAADQHAKLTCRTTECGQKCPKGTTGVTETNGQPGQLSTSARCPKGKYRSVCCDGGTTVGKCQWRGYRGLGLSCIGGCAEGETEVATANNNHDKKKGDQNCNGGSQSYCCAGFKPPPSKEELEKKAEDGAKAAAEAAAAQAALDVAAKAFCRIAVPALLAPLELLEDLIPIIGEILDLAEIAATPALIQLCVKGVEKEGKAEFKVFGKKHTLSMDKPTDKPRETRPPSSTHSPAKTSTKQDTCTRKEGKKNGKGLGKRDGCRFTNTVYTATAKPIYTTIRKVCDGAAHPQACMHYSSAIRYNPGRKDFNPLTCSLNVPHRNFGGGGTATDVWSREHNTVWRKWMRRKPTPGCERDEWPPHHFWQGRGDQIVRYNHFQDNRGAGSLWTGFCPENAETRCEPGSDRLFDNPRARSATLECRALVTLRVMSMDFDMEAVPLAQLRDDGLSANECYPKMLVDDPSFAILNGDNYFARNGRRPNALFANPPPAAMTNGLKAPFGKRSLMYPLESGYIMDTGNETRRLMIDELEEMIVDNTEFGEHLRNLDNQVDEFHVPCRGESCATEVTPAGRSTVLVVPTAPSGVEAVATAITVLMNESIGSRVAASSGSRALPPNVPAVTAAVFS